MLRTMVHTLFLEGRPQACQEEGATDPPTEREPRHVSRLQALCRLAGGRGVWRTWG